MNNNMLGGRVDHTERNILGAFGCVWALVLVLGIAFWGTVIWLAIRLVNAVAK